MVINSSSQVTLYRESDVKVDSKVSVYGFKCPETDCFKPNRTMIRDEHLEGVDRVTCKYCGVTFKVSDIIH